MKMMKTLILTLEDTVQGSPHVDQRRIFANFHAHSFINLGKSNMQSHHLHSWDATRKKRKNTVWMSIEYYSVNWSSDTSEADWLWMWRCFMATMNEMAWCGVSDFLKVKFWDVSSWTSEAGGVAHLSLLQRLAAIKFQARTTPPKKCTPFFFLAHISADEAVDSAP